MTGEIPKDINKLTKLRWLAITENEFTGTIPPALLECANLEWLAMANNKLSGSIPRDINKLQKINHIFHKGESKSGRHRINHPIDHLVKG